MPGISSNGDAVSSTRPWDNCFPHIHRFGREDARRVFYSELGLQLTRGVDKLDGINVWFNLSRLSLSLFSRASPILLVLGNV
jgi:hypothetical protein